MSHRHRHAERGSQIRHEKNPKRHFFNKPFRESFERAVVEQHEHPHYEPLFQPEPSRRDRQKKR